MNFLWPLSFWVLDFWFLLVFFPQYHLCKMCPTLCYMAVCFVFCPSLYFMILLQNIYSIFVAQLSCFWCLAKAVMEIIIHQFSSSQVTQLCLTLPPYGEGSQWPSLSPSPSLNRSLWPGRRGSLILGQESISSGNHVVPQGKVQVLPWGWARGRWKQDSACLPA